MKKLLTILLVSCFAFSAQAQEKDFELWTGVDVSSKVYKKTYASIEQNFRFNNNAGAFKTTFTDFGLSHRPIKGLKLAFGYRVGQRPSFLDADLIDHRYQIDASYRYKIKPVTFVFRSRFQSRYRNINSRENGKIPTNYNRNRLMLKFDLDNDFTPYIAAEVFFQLNNPDGNEVDNYRFAAGVNYDINKRQEVKVFIMNQTEINVNNPLSSTVLGISYSHRLKSLYKKKKKEETITD